MAVYDHEEQEQLERLKAWWAQHGNLISAVMALLALLVVAWQGWQWYQNRQSADASLLYSAVQKAVAENNPARAREAAGQLIEQYGRTAQAEMAVLMAAKTLADARDVATAKAQLGWLVEKGKDPALRDLARLRLATLLADEKAFDEALKLLAIDAPRPLVPRFADLLGDIRAAQGKFDEARKAYASALAALDVGDPQLAAFREILQLKLDALGA